MRAIHHTELHVQYFVSIFIKECDIIMTNNTFGPKTTISVVGCSNTKI